VVGAGGFGNIGTVNGDLTGDNVSQHGLVLFHAPAFQRPGSGGQANSVLGSAQGNGGVAVADELSPALVGLKIGRASCRERV